MLSNRPIVLSIAGLDPSAGAGILADIKTFENNQVYGLGVATAITYQNENQFNGLQWIDFFTIENQLNALFDQNNIDFVKIGLIESVSLLNNICQYLRVRNNAIKIIWDPIISSSTGFKFHNEIDKKEFKKAMGTIYLTTPNIDEAKMLFGDEVEINNNGNIYIKGGHSRGGLIKDTLYFDGDKYEFRSSRIQDGEKHGSGCVLSSAITSNLAKGQNLVDACKNARDYTISFLKSNSTLLGYHAN
ncbi:MAG: hydroxymethylpyrimidine/phosphomethylpyrimidine kinase [Bacteroidia bacterium]|nr:hydroxymethylpyrimidine/phosphomethylpyrimidine kinase [Bacteroidia bacterium]